MSASVLTYVVAAPGVDPKTVEVTATVEVLGWKFGEMTPEELIDQVAQVDKSLKALEKWVAGARDVIKRKLEPPTAALPETIQRGRMFEAHYVRTIRNAISQEKVKAILGDRIAEVMTETEVLTLRIVPVAQTPGVEG